MRRSESKFVSPKASAVAVSLGAVIRAYRLARNITQEAMAVRARMSALTWMKIEKGDVSVAMGTWLSALEQTGLLDRLDSLSSPGQDPLGEHLRMEQLRARARASSAKPDEYAF
jgi:transcriptional regulator with XRE-family HTH domain